MDKRQTKDFTVAIIGGGIAGVSLAISLNRRCIPVQIYEQAAAFGEIGAGVSFQPNAVQAMKICGQGLVEAFERVRTSNGWKSKEKVWFDYLDGTASTTAPSSASQAAGKHQKAEFVIRNSLGQSGVHRAHLLRELVKLLPPSIAHFGRRLVSLEQPATEHDQVVLHFEDGTYAKADAVVGCDGIKSRVRRAITGESSPAVQPGYSHKYAYRAMVPMQSAIEILGEENAMNSCMHMGQGAHMLTFPVQRGEMLNIVAFKSDPDEWTDTKRLTKPVRREEALRDFEHFGPAVTGLLNLAEPDLDCWAIFDLHDNPPQRVNERRLLIIGDAAHASSPHHGAGAGLAIEDAAVLAEMLADESVKRGQDIETVFVVFNQLRRSRGEWLVKSSRFIGDCYEWQAEMVGKDFKKIEAEINHRNEIIANVDVSVMCSDAQKELRERLNV